VSVVAEIFVSYSRADQAFVIPMVEGLEHAGFSVWWDRALEPGTAWADVIDRELGRALCVVVVWSRHSVASRWVGIEAHEARRRGILVPVALEPVTLEDEFAGMHRLDWYADGDPAEATRRLIEHVGRVASRARRRLWRAPAAMAAVVMLAVAAWLGAPRWWPGPPAPVVESTTIAVLPFRQDASLDAPGLGDGIAIDLIEELARLEVLRVASRVATWPAALEPLETIRERLRVAWLLEGDVAAASSGLEVRVRLVDTATGFLQANWVVNVPDDDLMKLRTAMARRVAEALPGITLASAAAAPAAIDGVAYRSYLQGRALLREGRDTLDRVRAESFLDQALALEPDFAPAHAGLCQVHLWRHGQSHDPDDLLRAVDRCGAAMALAPGDSNVILAQAAVYAARGDHHGAVQLLDVLLEREPGHTDARLQLARSLPSLGRSHEAEQAYLRILNEQPGHWDAHSHLAMFLWREGRAEEAVRQFVRALDLAPEEPTALSNLGASLLLADELQGATRAFQRSLAAGETAAALSNLGTAYYYGKRMEEAAALFERATSLAPNDFRLWSNLADARSILGEPRAADAYREAERLALTRLSGVEDDPTARVGVEAFRAALGTGSRDALDRVLGQVPSTWELEYYAALAYARHGDVGTAASRLSLAIHLGFPETLVRRDPLLAPLLEQVGAPGDGHRDSYINQGDIP
jgi:Flp pilus assembly protein TadD/TolB-like protein